MSDVGPRLSIVDIATIELMRTDSDYVRYCEGVDDRIDMAITAKFSKGTSAAALAQNPWMPRLIAQRAKLYCEEVLSIPINRHVEKLRDWFFGLGILGLAVLFFLGLTTAIGGPKLFFDEQMNANVSWILLLMLGMFLISLISMIGVVVMLIQWVRGDFQDESAESPKPTLVLSCVWSGLEFGQRLLNLIYRRELNPHNETMRHLKTVANRQSYFAEPRKNHNDSDAGQRCIDRRGCPRSKRHSGCGTVSNSQGLENAVLGLRHSGIQRIRKTHVRRGTKTWVPTERPRVCRFLK